MNEGRGAERSERLDQYVAREFPGVSRSTAATLIANNKVTVNGKTANKASQKIRPDDQIRINYEPSASAKISKLNLRVLYEDNDCVVINKPAGVLTHSKGAFNPEPTVATWLEGRVKDMSGERAGIVHRLDRATSGVMICGKTPQALKWLQKQFSERNVKKTYIAIVKGELENPEAIIDMPIERNPRKPQTFRVGANGKPATTGYKILESSNGYSLLQLRPTTGRTHQLRVHLHKLGHPIVGDELYGGPKAGRMYLHAAKLELTLPDKTRKTFEVPAPTSFKELLA